MMDVEKLTNPRLHQRLIHGHLGGQGQACAKRIREFPILYSSLALQACWTEGDRGQIPRLGLELVKACNRG